MGSDKSINELSNGFNNIDDDDDDDNSTITTATTSINTIDSNSVNSDTTVCSLPTNDKEELSLDTTNHDCDKMALDFGNSKLKKNDAIKCADYLKCSTDISTKKVI